MPKVVEFHWCTLSIILHLCRTSNSGGTDWSPEQSEAHGGSSKWENAGQLAADAAVVMRALENADPEEYQRRMEEAQRLHQKGARFKDLDSDQKQTMRIYIGKKRGKRV